MSTYDAELLRIIARQHLEAQDPLRKYPKQKDGSRLLLHPKQQQFYDDDRLEVMFGGAAFGGKSVAMLASALKFVTRPNYAAVLFRRTHTELAAAGALQSMAEEWLSNTDATWSEAKRRWVWPNGASLTFAHLSDAQAHYAHLGAEYHFVGIDECTWVPDEQYRLLKTRVRAGGGIPLRIRCATNPGGPFARWYRRHFIEEPEDRLFIPSYYHENPILETFPGGAEAYRKNLEGLDPIKRAQYLEGSWEDDASGKIYYALSDANIIDTLPATDERAPWVYSCGLDFGLRDATAFVVVATRRYDPNVYVVHAEKASGMTAVQVADAWRRLDAQYNLQGTHGDPASAQFVDTLRREHYLPITSAKKTDKMGNISLANGELANFKLLFTSGAEPLLAEMRELRFKNDAKREEHPSCQNHCADAFLYVWRAVRNATAYENRERIPKPGDPGYDDWITERALEKMRSKWADERSYDSILYGTSLVQDEW